MRPLHGVAPGAEFCLRTSQAGRARGRQAAGLAALGGALGQGGGLSPHPGTLVRARLQDGVRGGPGGRRGHRAQIPELQQGGQGASWGRAWGAGLRPRGAEQARHNPSLWAAPLPVAMIQLGGKRARLLIREGRTLAVGASKPPPSTLSGWWRPPSTPRTTGSFPPLPLLSGGCS